MNTGVVMVISVFSEQCILVFFPLEKDLPSFSFISFISAYAITESLQHTDWACSHILTWFLCDVDYLNNRVFLSRNYRLIVTPRKFHVLKTNICPRSEASRANMLVLRTSNFQGATIRPIVPKNKHPIVFIVHH